MANRRLVLRYDDICLRCGIDTPAGSTAMWDSTAKKVTCISCAEAATNPPALESPTAGWPWSSPWAPPAPIVTGDGGVSAAKEYERRRAKVDRQIEAKWGDGRLGKIAKTLADEPQSTAAWSRGASGERRLGDRMEGELAGVAVVLNDRRVPGTRGNIDHIVVAPSGVWIVDAKNYTGKVELRDVGGLFRTDLRLLVGGRNQTKLVDSMDWQVDKVREALTPIGFAGTQLRPALCFTNSEWPLFGKPLSLKGVTITWPRKLIESIALAGPLDEQTIRLLAHQLSTKLPATSAA